jgi:hypothetical protein
VLRNFFIAVIAFSHVAVGLVADLHGISLPDVRMIDGTQLQLNGIGLRTFSIFEIPIYVAGLYLERRNSNSDAILHSPEKKLLDIRFLHDVTAEEARDAWLDGFEKNCKAPCHLDPGDVQRFLAAVPSLQNGDHSTLLFTSAGVNITINGQPTGTITDANFAVVVLATFIGSEPPTPRLKRELLGGHH